MFSNFNGQLIPSSQPVFTGSNRAFRYGDAVFETIRVFEGRAVFLEKHWERLRSGLSALRLEVPKGYSVPFFEGEIAKLTNGTGNWRVRLSVFRSGDGLYLPQCHEPHFFLEATALHSSRFALQERGLTVGFHETTLLLAGIGKTANALPFVLAAIERERQGWDDCILVNQYGRVACGGSSNVFWEKNGCLYTPPLQDGGIAGTMRSIVFDICKQLPINCLQAKSEPSDLTTADAVFFTNAAQGIRWASRIEGIERPFRPGLTVTLVEALNQRIGLLL